MASRIPAEHAVVFLAAMSGAVPEWAAVQWRWGSEVAHTAEVVPLPDPDRLARLLSTRTFERTPR